MEIDLEIELETQVERSGVQYAVEYFGSVPIESSVVEMTPDLRTLVMNECIYMLAQAHNRIPAAAQRQPNSVARKIIGDQEPKVRLAKDLKSILNIQSSQFKILRDSAILNRHPISNVSVAAKGTFGKFFAYVAKNKNGEDRRCFVFTNEEPNVVLTTLQLALGLYYRSVFEKAAAERGAENALGAADRVNHADAAVQPHQPVQRQQGAPITGPGPDVAHMLDMYDEVWYHGLMTRGAAERLLRDEGDFLIRQSSSDHEIVLSYKVAGGSKHMHLFDNGKLQTAGRSFDSVKAFINFHVTTNTPLASTDSQFYLIRGVPRPWA